MGFLFESEHFTRQRVNKRQRFGMQIHPIPTFAVERIAHDGAIQPVGVRCMYPQLVGTPRERIKGHFC